jgi:hypothetical protein
LMHWPFRPDHVILGCFSGSFARCVLSTTLGQRRERIIGPPRRKIHNPNSSMKSRRYSVTTTAPWTPSAPRWSGSYGSSVSMGYGHAKTSSPPAKDRRFPDWHRRISKRGSRDPEPGNECPAVPRQAGPPAYAAGHHQCCSRQPADQRPPGHDMRTDSISHGPVRSTAAVPTPPPMTPPGVATVIFSGDQDACSMINSTPAKRRWRSASYRYRTHLS